LRFKKEEGKMKGDGRNGVWNPSLQPPCVKILTVEDHHSYSVLEHELVLLVTQQRCQEFIKRQKEDNCVI
jgi:hypothetical protein